jgi:hypothetical protein
MRTMQGSSMPSLPIMKCRKWTDWNLFDVFGIKARIAETFCLNFCLSEPVPTALEEAIR